MTIRKQHVAGPSQDRLMEVLCETGGGELPTIAEFFGTSEATIRRRADGLVYQGKLRIVRGRSGGPPAWYEPAGLKS